MALCTVRPDKRSEVYIWNLSLGPRQFHFSFKLIDELTKCIYTVCALFMSGKDTHSFLNLVIHSLHMTERSWTADMIYI